MKLAQVNVYFQPFMVGGAEWYVYNISKELVKLGHEVEVFTASKYGKQLAPPFETLDGIAVHRLPFKLDWSYRLKIWKGLGTAISSEKFDLIHTYDYAQSHTRTALHAAKESHTPCALTVFDIHSLIPRAFYKQVPMRMFERLLARGLLEKADRILVRAPTLLKPLISLGLEEKKLVVTPSGINDASLGFFDGPAFLESHKISGRPVILFLGRLNPLKGPQQLIKACPFLKTQFPELALVFVGADQGGYLAYLQKLSKQLGVEPNVHFLGPIYDYEEKMRAYSSCDVFALPTTYEGTSQAIFEAMSQARPIVATRVGGIPSQLEEGKEGILIPYGDTQALAASITRLLEDRKFATELGTNAKNKVRAFRYSVLATQLVQIYENMLGQ